jgi:hypothetical protein
MPISSFDILPFLHFTLDPILTHWRIKQIQKLNLKYLHSHEYEFAQSGTAAAHHDTLRKFIQLYSNIFLESIQYFSFDISYFSLCNVSLSYLRDHFNAILIKVGTPHGQSNEQLK